MDHLPYFEGEIAYGLPEGGLALGQLYQLEFPRQDFLLGFGHPVEILIEKVLDIDILHVHDFALAGWFGEHFPSEEDVSFL